MLYRYFIAFILIFFFVSNLNGQCLSKPEILEKVFNIENNASLNDEQKLKSFYALEKTASRCLRDKDSVHAWIFLKIGKYEFIAYHNYENTIKFTNIALQINNYSIKGASTYLNINAYFNLGSAYETLLSYAQSLKNYDSSIYLASKFIDTNSFALDARYAKSNIYFASGDYQKAVEESIKGIHLAEIEENVSSKISFLNMQAQALFFQNNIEESLPIAYTAAEASKKINNADELASACKTMALIYNQKKLYDSAKRYYVKAITNRLTTTLYSNIGADYNEFGNFYNELNDYKNAARCYQQFLYYSSKINNPIDRSVKTAFAYLNYGENYSKQNNLDQAAVFYLKSMNTLKLNVTSILQNPSVKKISVFGSRAELIITLMNNKTELLLKKYKENHRPEYLKACVQTALVTDSIITQIRHEHVSEQSKIYWRDKTNKFYATAIEACYLNKNASLAFYFFEKSRAVLLGDKLNELNASSYLPEIEIKKEESYQSKIVELEQKLAAMNERDKQFQYLQLQLLNAKDNFEHYIKSLEQKYPLYYQYKYADKVPALNELQSYLLKNKQNFIHYYFDDSVTYILAVMPAATKFLRLSFKDFDKDQLQQFLKLCSGKQSINNNYKKYIGLSHSIYKTIFQPLKLSKGRVIVCANNITVPFDAFCTDDKGKNFLLNDYSFSYVYSSSFLLKSFNKNKATGSFVGFAPVTFKNQLLLNPLLNAATALNACASYYKSYNLFTNETATRNNFFKYASAYSILSIFSHAAADTTGKEPKIFMQDSVINLSELQKLNNPATRLVILSACQTNVGKNATGEGIYSLARGFATAGIPSVAATLWKANEQSIYTISEKFNQYLSEGMNADEALQKAKLYFIKNNNSSEKMLPYYWANMILIGEAGKIKLSNEHNNFWWWFGSCFCFITVIASTIFLLKKKRRAL